MSQMAGELERWPIGVLRGVSIEPENVYRAVVSSRVCDMQTQVAFYTWWWFESGGAVVDSSGQTFQIQAGQWFLQPPHSRRHHRIEQGSMMISMHFRAVWPSSVPLLQMAGPVVGSGDDLAGRRLYRLSRQVCRARGSDGRRAESRNSRMGSLELCLLRGRLCLFVEALFSQVLDMRAGELTGPGSGDPRLDWVLSAMQQHLGAGPLPLQAWSRQVGLSGSQLNRLCQRLLGVSLRARRDQMLVEELRQRLVLGGESIKQLAAGLGFVDTAHLCRWTRRQTGRSPMQIRQGPVA